MPEHTSTTLNHFALFSFKEPYWALSADGRGDVHRQWLAGLRKAAGKVEVYQVFPTEAQADVLVWSAVSSGSAGDAAAFFTGFAQAANPVRAYLQAATVLWGYTHQSQYTKTRSAQEIDPFGDQRKPYLIVYPFVKTADWYLMGREARQGFMNEHIRIGKQYEDIRQLLLYSFGLQDQEFVVVYETDDLARFSALVNELRSAEGRRYTLRDAPLHTAIYHPAEETLALWQ